MLALGQFLLANEYGPLWRSADTGTNWTQITCPIYDIRCFAIVGNTVYAANGGLVRSLDSGATWSVVPTTFSVLSLTSHGTNLFAAASDGLHYLDSGGIWHDAGFAGKECMLIYAFDTLRRWYEGESA